ncbi:phosphonate ABC transporter, permease protein PhnE [Pseudooceanicola sp.]|uniref:phosphonate ABC transporter, permease protein PhnE n=1 Tax=Pseudooceanicola sp. TaxID=1914328 RepID=UPI003517F29E
MTHAASLPATWSYRSRTVRLALWAGWLALVALFVWCWQIMTQTTIWAFVLDAPRQAADIGARMVPPKWGYLPELMLPLWDTLNIATLGTMGGVILAVPVALMAARNTTPSATILRPIALFVIVASRSINSLIWALLLVTIIGPGLLAGIIAIALRSIGFIGKLFYEAIEETDPTQIEAIEATGAGPVQVLTYGVVPQVMPTLWGISVFRWDINIRESTILGLVGAGGIGLKLNASMAVLAWDQVTVILLLILGTVIASEWVAAWVRRTII